MGDYVEKKLLTVKDMCVYLSIGDSEARRLLNSDDCNFRVRIGIRLYANKTLLDKWIDSISGK